MLTLDSIKKVGRMMAQTSGESYHGPALHVRRPLPSAMVLVYEPLLTHSTWQDFSSRHRTLRGLERALRAGVRRGEWVAWRLIRIEKEVMGNEAARAAGCE